MRLGRRVAAGDLGVARVVAQQGGERAHRGRLPRSVRAEQPEHRPSLHLQVEAVQGRLLAVPLDQAVRADRCHHPALLSFPSLTLRVMLGWLPLRCKVKKEAQYFIPYREATMVTYAGQGDPRRTMELLWGVPTAAEATPRGPKPGITVDDIVAAATDIADSEGFDAVSMRSVGERLGRTAMALYTYVPSKAELVDLMLDRALRELDITYDVADGWRAAARRWALDLWDFYLRHPWVHQISSARPVLGPGSYLTMERPAELFASTDLNAADVMKIVGTVSGFVAGMTRQIAELREATRAVGQTEMDWWTTQSELIAELVPDVDARFPRLAAANAEGAFDFEHEPEQYLEQEARNGFEFGLERAARRDRGVPQPVSDRGQLEDRVMVGLVDERLHRRALRHVEVRADRGGGLPVVLEHRSGLQRRHLTDRILGVGLLAVDLAADPDRAGRPGVVDPADRSVRRHEEDAAAAVDQRDRRAALLTGPASDRGEHDGARDEVPGDQTLHDRVADPPAGRHLETLGRPGGRAPLAHVRSVAARPASTSSDGTARAGRPTIARIRSGSSFGVAVGGEQAVALLLGVGELGVAEAGDLGVVEQGVDQPGEPLEVLGRGLHRGVPEPLLALRRAPG